MLPSVWAPNASAVDLVIGDARVPMTRSGAWWETDRALPPGTDYAFSLDGGPGRPDPRSAWQPAGVHGPSRVFDAAEHDWSDDTWPGVDARGAVLYELHVGTFTPEGTLAAAAAELPALVELGVDMVELMPIAPFDGDRGWGYDGVGLYAVHAAYGGPLALQQFVDTAHRLGLGVCLDMVYNHLGPSGAYVGEYGPYWTDAHETPWGAAINLDQPGSGEVRRWIIESALWWLTDFHVDALRLDAVHALADDGPVHLLAQLSDRVADLSATVGRPLSLIAESDLNDAVSITPTAEGGWGMTAQWADDVHHAIHSLLTGERHGYYVDFGTPEVLRKALTSAFVHDGTWSTFRGTSWGRHVPSDTHGHRFVVSVQTHDQVGNRATGDRPSERHPDVVLAASAALMILSPFTPMLFMGEEWGTRTPFQFFTSYADPPLAAAVREGRVREFGGHGWAELYGGDVDVPDPQALSTFEASTLDRAELADPAHARMLDWYRTLIRLRRTVPDLASGDLTATDLTWGGGSSDGPWDGWLVLRRGSAQVVVNLSDEWVSVPSGGELAVVAEWTGGPSVSGSVAPRSITVLA